MKSFQFIAAFILFAVTGATAQTSTQKLPNGFTMESKTVSVKEIVPIHGEFKQFGFSIRPDFRTVEAYSVCPPQAKPFIMVYKERPLTTYGATMFSSRIITDNNSIVVIYVAYKEPTEILGYEYTDRTTGGETVKEGINKLD